MKRVSIFGAIMVLALGLALYVSYARSTFGEAAISASPAQVPVAASIGVFTSVDMPVSLTALEAIRERSADGREERLTRLQCVVAGKGVAAARSLNLSLFEFNANGGLTRVDGWVRTIALTEARGTARLSLELARRLPSASRFLLTVDRVHGESQTWETPFLTLAQATRLVAAGDNQADAQVARVDYALPELAGASLCSYAQARAMQLAQAGDQIGYTSFTCDQTERSYTISFNSKQL